MRLKLAVINLQGRTFMPPLDCPFKKADELIAEAKKRTNIIFVDFHAEATSEKQAMGWYLRWQGYRSGRNTYTCSNSGSIAYCLMALHI